MQTLQVIESKFPVHFYLFLMTCQYKSLPSASLLFPAIIENKLPGKAHFSFILSSGTSLTDKYVLCQFFSAFCFHYFTHEILDIFPAVPVFRGICYVIRLNQNLMIYAINFFQGVVMPNKVSNINLRRISTTCSNYIVGLSFRLHNF